MIKSMTGYGVATSNFASAKYTVEIKSLNSKFLELALKLPKAFSDKELQIRNDCTRLVERGKVSLVFTVEYPEGNIKPAAINKSLLKAYYDQIRQSAEELGDTGSNILQLALGFPEVISTDESTASDEEWQVFYNTFLQALNNFQTFRQDEGRVLQQDLAMRIEKILSLLAEVEKLDPNRIPAIRERINQLLEDNVGRENIDQNRFEQELIYYIDKLDITEEKIRLKSHCDYFLKTLQNEDANGKKLGFISQEIGREINTTGSKANDAQIQQLVVGMKEELEKIKEQLLNVL
ncbi:YicC/YloC family endoribonuclease [Pedobacter sp. BS3]|uniref:YicC/YloC family endoribonuclease n=1 Tax=Pedobacter sp. BS3 TaxID=2567937 RepID=UPI001F5B2F85|nr:YicC/YloC family endoribonuclease [Pedobacter sp. BS3]